MRTWTLVVSICAHAVVVAAIFVSPTLATTDLPAPRRPLTFEAITPLVPTAHAPARPKAHASTAAQLIPVTELRDLPPEIPAPVCGPPADVVAQAGTGVPTDSFAPLGDPVIASPPPPARKDPVPVGSGIRPPMRVVYVPPVYPPMALAAHKEGTVILQAVIDEMGNVREVKVLRSVLLLDDAALQAVANWKFTPTLLNGTAVPVVMTVTVAFTLTK